MAAPRKTAAAKRAAPAKRTAARRTDPVPRPDPFVNPLVRSRPGPSQGPTAAPQAAVAQQQVAPSPPPAQAPSQGRAPAGVDPAFANPAWSAGGLERPALGQSVVGTPAGTSGRAASAYGGTGALVDPKAMGQALWRGMVPAQGAPSSPSTRASDGLSFDGAGSNTDAAVSADQYEVYYPTRTSNPMFNWDTGGLDLHPGSTVDNQRSTVAKVATAFWQFSEKELGDLSNLYKQIKGTSSDPSQDELHTFWEQYVANTGATNHQNGTQLTPWDLLAMAAKGAKPVGSGTQQTATSTSTTVSLTDPVKARGIVDSTLRTMLGRAATADEVSTFLATLQSAERANPNVSQTTTTGNSDGTNQTSNTMTVQQGGVDAGQMALEYARSRPDYAEYQAATTYLDAFMQAIR